MDIPTWVEVAASCVTEARRARLGLGNWSQCSEAVRASNARSQLAQAASVRRTYATVTLTSGRVALR